MAKYRMQQMPDLAGNGKRVKYPKIVIERCIGLRQIAQDIAQASSFTTGDVEGVVAALAHAVGQYAAGGYSVRIDGIGIFTPSLGLKRGVEPETDEGGKRNAASIQVRNIRFRPEKTLVQQVDRMCTLKRDKVPHYISPRHGREERLAIALQYIEQHGLMTGREYAALTNLAYSSACRELNRFHAEKLLKQRGSSRRSFYVLPDAEGG